MSRFRGCSVAAAFAFAAAACTIEVEVPVPTADEAAPIVDRLLEAGDVERAAALAERAGLGEHEPTRTLAIETWIASGEYDRALEALPADTGSPELRTLTADACAMGALAAWEQGDAAMASQRLARCAEQERVDLVVLRYREAVEAGESPDDRTTRLAVEAIRDGQDGPERDLAAEELETILRALKERATDPVIAVGYQRRAFEIAGSPEFGETLAQDIYDTADAVSGTRPQDAATLFERLYLNQVVGLTVPMALQTQARDRARASLFPVFVGNYRARFDRKWRDDDIAAGIYSAEADSFSFETPTTAAEREVIQRWVYSRLERPAAIPLPSFVEQSNHCEADACSFTVEELARMAYDCGQLEQDHARSVGQQLVYE
jgi:hypothetical protein